MNPVINNNCTNLQIGALAFRSDGLNLTATGYDYCVGVVNGTSVGVPSTNGLCGASNNGMTCSGSSFGS